MDPWVQFDDALVASSAARLLCHSDRFWAAVRGTLAGAPPSAHAAQLVPAEGAGRRLIASHIEFAVTRVRVVAASDDRTGAVAAVLDDPQLLALICFELMNRVPTVGPTGSRRQRRLRELDYGESLELLERVLAGCCIAPGCDEPAGDRFGDPVYRSDARKRVAARSWCCGRHAVWEREPGRGTAAIKRVRDLLRFAASVPHERDDDGSDRNPTIQSTSARP